MNRFARVLPQAVEGYGSAGPLRIAVEEIDEALGWLDFMDKGRIAADKKLAGEAGEL